MPMHACAQKTGVAELFSANIIADGTAERIARGSYILSQFGPLADKCALAKPRLDVRPKLFGDACRALFHEDGVEYEADIADIRTEDCGNKSTTVVFVGYGNEGRTTSFQQTVCNCGLCF